MTIPYGVEMPVHFWLGTFNVGEQRLKRIIFWLNVQTKHWISSVLVTELLPLFWTSALEDVTSVLQSQIAFTARGIVQPHVVHFGAQRLDSLWSSTLVENSEEAISLNDAKWNPTSAWQPLSIESICNTDFCRCICLWRFLYARRPSMNVTTSSPHANPRHSI